MSVLTEGLLEDKEEFQMPPRISLARASTVNIRDFRTSGIDFERITMKKTLLEGRVKRNIFAASAIDQQNQGMELSAGEMVRQFQKKDRMNDSALSYHSLNSDTGEFEPTVIDGDVFFDAKESLERDRRVSEIVQSIVPQRRQSMIRPQLQSQLGVARKASPQKSQKNKRIYTKKYHSQKVKEKVVRNYTEIISQFFGEGINSLILKLSPRVIAVLRFNLLLDWVFRLALIWYSLQCYLELQDVKRVLFAAPLIAQVVSRVIFFLLLIKMSFDETRKVSEAYQMSVENKNVRELQEDRMFLRQFTREFYVKVFIRGMVPPEFYMWELMHKKNKWRDYYMLNTIFKGIEFVFVLGTLAVILLIETRNSAINPSLLLMGFSLMLEEIIRYVVNYLVINTLS